MTDYISRADAHKVLSELSTEGGKDAKMLFMDAHEWIDEIPSANETPTLNEKHQLSTETPTTDLISRADVLALAEKGYIISNSNYKKVCDLINAIPSADAVQGVGRYENAMQKLRDMPRYLNGVKAKQIKKISADRPSGKWEYRATHRIGYACSLCGGVSIIESNYCPNCGAKMKGDNE